MINDPIKEEVMSELHHTFKPEFINRIDEIIIFKSLTKEVVYSILDKIISEIEQRLSDKKIKISLTDSAKKYIIDSSYDEKYGARPIKRFVSRNVETLLAHSIIMGQIKYNDNIIVDYDNNNLFIKTK